MIMNYDYFVICCDLLLYPTLVQLESTCDTFLESNEMEKRNVSFEEISDNVITRWWIPLYITLLF